MIALLSAVSGIPSTWPTTILKVSVLLAAAGLVSLALYRASAAVRHLAWFLALAASVVLAVSAPIVPRIDVPVRAMMTPPARLLPAIASDARVPRARPVVIVGPRAITIARRPMEIVIPATAEDPGAAPKLAGAFPFIPLIVWFVGFALVTGRARLGHSRLASIVDDAQRLTSADWRAAIRDASIDVGVKRDVEVFESDEVTSPMTSGFLNPVIVVPMEAREWNAERRHIVLVHELAHIARFDYLAQLIATLACAIFWFHPLAWIAASRLRAEAEHAADDHVLNAGTVGVTYATHLLDIARQHSGDLTPAAAVGMVRSSRLEGRFRAMLDSRRSRASVSARLQAFAATVTFCAMLPVAALRPVAAHAQARVARFTPRMYEDYARVLSQQLTESLRREAEARSAASDVTIALGSPADSLFEKTIDASSGDKLTLDLRSGAAISIHGWDEPRIRVVGRLGGRDWRDTRVSLERVPGGVRLRSEMEFPREQSSTSHEFELWVPRHTNIQLSSSGGSLAINDLSGDFHGRTGGGGITIEGATGSATLSTGGGEIAVTNSHLSGTVTTGAGELSVTNVTGGLRGNSGTGETIVSNTDGFSTVRGGVGYGVATGIGNGVASTIASNGVTSTITTSGFGARAVGRSGALAVSKDGGEIVIDQAPNGAILHTGGGRIVVGSSGRSVSANTGGGDIELENVGGDATASTGSGDVRISVVNAGRADHSVDVESGSGRVVIEVPADVDARIELETAYTENFNRKTSIASDFSLERSETDQWDSSAGTPRKYVRAVGVVGSGRGLIRVHTVNGDVVLKRVNR